MTENNSVLSGLSMIIQVVVVLNGTVVDSN